VGNEPINGIGEEGWNQAEESGDGGPGLRQLAEGGKDSARANEDLGLLGERRTGRLMRGAQREDQLLQEPAKGQSAGDRFGRDE